MKSANILVIGGGIGGLTAAIALRQHGFEVDLLERNPKLTVYGVGIIQQANVLRAIDDLNVLDAYVEAGYGFDHIYVFIESGRLVAKIPSPRLVERYPANLGISRRSLHEVLTDKATELGAHLDFGFTTTHLEDTGSGVVTHFESRESKRYDLVVAADGIHSDTRSTLFPSARPPQFTGQSVWRYNFARPKEVDGIWTYSGKVTAGLVPLSEDGMYMFVVTQKPNDERPLRAALASRMRAHLGDACAALRELSTQIVDDTEVVYRPLEWILLQGPWHRGRIVLLGDAVHATTPHLGQGAGMAIEDAVVLAQELASSTTHETAFEAYRARRYDRCAYIVKNSKAIGDGQLGKIPPIDPARATREMFDVIARPI